MPAQPQKRNFFSRLEYQYEVTFGLYMLTTTEKIVLSICPRYQPDCRLYFRFIFHHVGIEFVVLFAESYCYYFETCSLLFVSGR